MIEACPWEESVHLRANTVAFARQSSELARQVPGYEIRDLLEATIGGNTQRAALAAPRKAADTQL